MIRLNAIKKKMPGFVIKAYDSIGIERALLKCYKKIAEKRIVREYINSEDPEKKEVAEYVKRYGFTSVFPYEYRLKYKNMEKKVYRDPDGYPYVLHGEKKLFFKPTMTDKEVERLYLEMMSEQDIESPHCYVQQKNREPKEGCIIAELGAAEAMFTLDWIERCKKAYLFECDETWGEVYERTFAPWIEKIEIVKKYVGSGGDESNTIQLDDYFRDKDISLVKADIEGAEVAMLDGGTNVFLHKIDQAYLCTYHRCDHPKIIKEKLDQYGFSTEFNRRFMFLFTSPSEFEKNTFRRGLIYGYKETRTSD